MNKIFFNKTRVTCGGYCLQAYIKKVHPSLVTLLQACQISIVCFVSRLNMRSVNEIEMNKKNSRFSFLTMFGRKLDTF